MRYVITTAIVCVLTVARPVPAVAADWYELKTPHFTIWAEADNGATRTLAWQLEQMRTVATALWPWMKVDLPRPLIVIALKNEAGMRAIAPQYWEVKNGVRPASVWVSAPDHHYIAIRTDVGTRDNVMVNPHISAYFSYASLVLASSFGPRAPAWLLRGLGGVMSNTLVREDDVVVGAAIPWHLETLRTRPKPLAEMLSDTAHQVRTRTDEGLRAFDAQAWAFVHYLMFSEAGVHAPKLNAFVAQVDQGQSADAAFAAAIGEAGAYQRAFTNYVNRSIFTASRIKVDLNLDRSRFPVRRMAPVETAAARASFHLALRRTADARALIDDALKLDPSSPLPVALEAQMLDQGGDSEAASAGYEKAVSLGTSNAYVLYRAAMLKRREATAAALEQAEVRLARAVEANPLFAAAHAALAEVRAELKRSAASIAPHMHKAVALEPSSPWHRILAARTLARLGSLDDARKAAESALKLADDDASARAEAERLLARYK
jgi:tetratricopeptide (TPR) repeat protein